MSMPPRAAVAPSQQQNVADAVSRIFSDLQREMDTIVNSESISMVVMDRSSDSALQPKQHPTEQLEPEDSALPLVRLNHGRTESQNPGYDDEKLACVVGSLPCITELEDPNAAAVCTLSCTPGMEQQPNPVVIGSVLQGGNSEVDSPPQDTQQSSTAVPPSAPISVLPSLNTALSAQQFEQQLQDGITKAEKLLSAPATASPWQQLREASAEGRAPSNAAVDSEKGSPLSYKELLHKALAWRPKAKGTAGCGADSSTAAVPQLTKKARGTSDSSKRVARDSGKRLRSSSGSSSKSSAGGGARSAHLPADKVARGAASAGSVREPWCPAAATANIFSDFDGKKAHTAVSRRASSMQRDTSPGGRSKAQHRSRSAPRETTAVLRHVQRMSLSPTRAPPAAAAVTAGFGDSNALLRAGRLQGIHTAAADVFASARKSSKRCSDTLSSRRLGIEDLSSAGARNSKLHTIGTFSPPLQQQQRSSTRANSPGRPRARSSSTGPAVSETFDSEFFRRQEGLLLRRAQLAAQRRPSDEGDLQECTFHPQINPASKSLQRSVKQLHAWDARRKLTVFAKALDKCEHEFEGYTFAPSINPLSRQLALANYAVAPDPGRPWTNCPRAHLTASSPVRSPSPEAMRMLRDVMPPAKVMVMAGSTAQQHAGAVLDMLGGPGHAQRTKNSSRQSAPVIRTQIAGPPAVLGEEEGLIVPSAAAVAPPVAAVAPPVAAVPEEHQEGEGAAEMKQDATRVMTSHQPATMHTVIGIPVALPALGLPVAAMHAAAAAAAAAAAPAQECGLHTAGLSHHANGPTAAPGSGPDPRYLAQIPGPDPGFPVELQGNAGKVAAVTHAAMSHQDLSGPTDSRLPAEQHQLQNVVGKDMQQQQQPEQDLELAVKLEPSAGQQGDKSSGAVHWPTVSSTSTPGNSVARRAACNSSSGGMAPGTPVHGSGGGNLAWAQQAQARERMRDDSAGGMYMHTPSFPRKSMQGGRDGTGGCWEDEPGSRGKRSSSSPLSRSKLPPQQQCWSEQLLDARTPARTSQGLGRTAEEQHQQQGGLQLSSVHCAAPEQQEGPLTLSAYCVHALATSSDAATAAAGLKQRPCSYAEKHKHKEWLRGGQHNSATSAGLLADSVTANGTVARTAAATGVGGGTDTLDGSNSNSSGLPDSPTFHEVKAAWLEKEITSLRELAASGASHLKSAAISRDETSTEGSPAHRADSDVVLAPTATAAADKDGSSGSTRGTTGGGSSTCVAAQEAFPHLQQALWSCSSVVSVPDIAAGGGAPASESCNGSSQLLVASNKVEVLLEGTQSVPFELGLSPRHAKGTLTPLSLLPAVKETSERVSTGAQLTRLPDGPVDGQGGEVRRVVPIGRMADSAQAGQAAPKPVYLQTGQWQQQPLQGPLGAYSHAPLTAAPVWPHVHDAAVFGYSTPTLDAVTQLLTGQTCTTGSNSSSSGLKTAAAIPAAAAFTGQSTGPLCAPVVCTLGLPAAAAGHLSFPGSRSFVRSDPQGAMALAGVAGDKHKGTASSSSSGCGSKSSCMPLAGDHSIPALFQQQQQQQEHGQGEEGQGGQPPQPLPGADLAAELAALLQSAVSMSPEQKAQTVARTFAKTLSHLNMSTDVLRQTMAVLDPDNAALNSTPAGAAGETSLDESSATSAAPQQTAVASAPTPAGPQAHAHTPTTDSLLDMTGLQDCDVSEANSIQQLLEQVTRSASLAATHSTPPAHPAVNTAQQQQQRDSDGTTPVSDGHDSDVCDPRGSGAEACCGQAALPAEQELAGPQVETSCCAARKEAPAAAGCVGAACVAAAAAAVSTPAGESPKGKSWAAVVAATDSL